MWSKYNFFFTKESQHFLYNTLSNGFLELDEDLYNTLKQAFEDNCLPTEISSETEALLKNIKAIGTDDDFEDNKLEYISNARNFSNTHIQLTINPTLGCNFACPYCFEHKHEPDMMSDETEADIIKYVTDHMTAKSLSVTWFGGEPLMAFKRIESLTDKLVATGLEYNASIVSNGYLLTEHIAKRLEALKIRSIQITLDGLKPLHDSRRHLIGGGATFNTIIANIKRCQKVSPSTRVVIRVNIDRTNQSEFPNLYKYIANLHLPNVIVSPAFVNDCAADEPNPDILSDTEKADFIKKLYTEHGLIFDFFYPSSHRAGCSIRNMNTLVIGPKGELYRCWEDVGNEERVYGNIKGHITNSRLLMRYINASNQFKDAKCRECILLPLCAGGCPKHRMANIYEGKKIDVCPLLKHNMEDFLYLHYLTKQSKKSVSVC